MVSTTALHWLPPAALAALYAEVATVLRPGGLLLDGDHLAEDQTASPALSRLGRALIEREERRQPARSGGRDLGRLVGGGPGGPGTGRPGRAARPACTWTASTTARPPGRLAVHVEALRKAGFAEVGTLWQRGDNRLLCAILA